MAGVHLPQTLGKRERSADSRSSINGDSVTALDVSSRESSVENEEVTGIPAFLTQSYSELRSKFEELEWLQRGRISSGLLAGDPSHQWALESSPEVRERSRYANVQAWANSRIHLKVPPGECDFINASPIELRVTKSQETARYIATQGPKAGHLTHFWNMIFHETGEVAIVVMLTQTFEAGREKCAQYFPLSMEVPTFKFSPVDSDPFIDHKEEDLASHDLSGSITLLECFYEESCCSEVRKLKLDVGTESKIVWHFLFAGWSDYAKPEGQYRDALVELTKITAEKAKSPENPRIVHCSAGVGRTGTFIALDHLLRELRNGNLLDVTDDNIDTVFDTVNQLREQRMMMVYNDIQYQFIYDVLKEQAYTLLGKMDLTGASSCEAESATGCELDAPTETNNKGELEAIVD
ncbi:tyrosine protein phosphatase 1 [Emydomyces testavorans]|uniref:Tyrosine protein phosphatase 1 n=1 Tax=Emydomyces testavorans TaxID=2070801 RepID=A0AAF0DBS1_9EURO|nr:tyrosine protein phosphatase 1 [Emydomyces testavorans]